jgi:hypothetical protein
MAPMHSFSVVCAEEHTMKTRFRSPANVAVLGLIRCQMIFLREAYGSDRSVSSGRNEPT